jgi:endo-1,4-beta-xylanase
MKKVQLVLLVALLSAGLAFISCGDVIGENLVEGPAVGAAPLAATQTITGKLEQQGTHDGYDYELWADKGTVKMVLENGGNFSCEWSNIGNILCRKGKKLGSTKKYTEYGNITIEYNATFNPNGNAYLCVYGWSKDPLVEYYIVESW